MSYLCHVFLSTPRPKRPPERPRKPRIRLWVNPLPLSFFLCTAFTLRTISFGHSRTRTRAAEFRWGHGCDQVGVDRSMLRVGCCGVGKRERGGGVSCSVCARLPCRLESMVSVRAQGMLPRLPWSPQLSPMSEIAVLSQHSRCNSSFFRLSLTHAFEHCLNRFICIVSQTAWRGQECLRMLRQSD